MRQESLVRRAFYKIGVDRIPLHAKEVTKRTGFLRAEPSVLDQILHVQTDRDRNLRVGAANARTHTFEPCHCRSAGWRDTAVRVLVP
jgi:hypothetical protein